MTARASGALPWAFGDRLLWARATSTVAPLQVSVADLADDAALVIGLALVAAALAALVAAAYRWYVRERVPGGLPILVGLSGVAVYLNSSRALRQVIDDAGDPIAESVALFNIVVFLVSAAAARAGTDVGDRIGSDVFVATGGRKVETEVGRVVQAVGRVITVELPEEIDDIVGYDPVPDETKETLAGKSFVFPRRLTVAELRERLTTRLKADYAVGHVDLELTDDGEVSYLALGSRAAGIGPTLPPETAAVAVRADPAFSASAGDLVQVWRTDPAERVLTAELRGRSGDVVTLAIDAADTRKLDDTARYRLVTLPVEKRADREFASLLRAADETMAAVPVEAGSALAGQSVGALGVTVVAVRPPDGPVQPLPQRDRRIDAGDVLYLVATPDAIRKVETAAAVDGDGTAGGAPGSEMPPDHRIGPGTPVAGDDAEAAGAAGSESDEAAGDGSPTAETEERTAPAEPGEEIEAVEPDDEGEAVELDDDAEATEPGEEIEAVEPDDEGEAVELDDEGEAAEPDGEGESADATEGSDADLGLDLGDPELTDLDADPSDGPAVEGDPFDLDEGGEDPYAFDEDGGADGPDEESEAGGPDEESDDVDEESDDDGDEESDAEAHLEDLPGTDPDELVGTGVESVDDVDGLEGPDDEADAEEFWSAVETGGADDDARQTDGDGADEGAGGDGEAGAGGDR